MAQMPMPEGPQQEQPQESSMNPSELIVGVNDGLTKLATIMERAQGIDPAAKEAIAQALQSFQVGVEAMLGKGGGQGPAPAQGVSSMEAGSSPNAVPAM